MITFACPSCSKTFKVADDLAGRKAKCPCGESLTVPQAEPSVAPPAAPTASPAPAPLAEPTPVASPAPPPVASEATPTSIRPRSRFYVAIGAVLVVALLAGGLYQHSVDGWPFARAEVDDGGHGVVASVDPDEGRAIAETQVLGDDGLEPHGPASGQEDGETVRDVDMVTFMRAFAEGESDRYLGYLVHGGGPWREVAGRDGRHSTAIVLPCGRRNDGSFYHVKKLNGTWDSGRSDTMCPVVLVCSREISGEATVGSFLHADELKAAAESFKARFNGVSRDVVFWHNGSQIEAQAPVLDWEGDATIELISEPPALSEPEQAADTGGRTFNSDLPLKVYIVRTPDAEEEWVGTTPSQTPVEIPECQYWYVMPHGPVDFEKLSQEVLSADIPGLKLVNATNDDLSHLAGLTGLQELNLFNCIEITDAGMAHLKGLTGLRRLNLQLTRFTDEGMANLAGLTDLQELDLTFTGGTDAGLAHLAGLTDLRTLRLVGVAHTDAGLSHLAGLTNLQELYLASRQVTDAGMAHLAGLTDLQKLSLPGTITDAGMAYLADLTALQELRIGYTKITDAGLVHLEGLTDLQKLKLPETITDAGLADLAGLTTLRELDLSRTEITDAGLEHLAGLTDLQRLYLLDTKITDAGLEHLVGLTSLQWLDLRGVQVTQEGVAKLRTALPGAHVDQR